MTLGWVLNWKKPVKMPSMKEWIFNYVILNCHFFKITNFECHGQISEEINYQNFKPFLVIIDKTSHYRLALNFALALKFGTNI